MHPQAEQIQYVIAGLKVAQDELPQMLPELPSAVARVQADLQRSINFLSHIGGMSLPNAIATADRTFGPINPREKAPATTAEERMPRRFGPIKVDWKRPTDVAAPQTTSGAFDIKGLPAPSATDLEMQQLQHDVNEIYPQFLERDSAELLDSLTDLQLRGVAKKAGLRVTEEEPERLTLGFVEEIKSAIRQKEAAANAGAANKNPQKNEALQLAEENLSKYQKEKTAIEARLGSLRGQFMNAKKNEKPTEDLQSKIDKEKEELQLVNDFIFAAQQEVSKHQVSPNAD